MKTVISSIAQPLAHIINQTFVAGIVPDEMKLAKVVPIHKSGNVHIFNNYRPISLLPAFSKLMEKTVAIRLISFLNSSNILFKHQYGFRKKHSTIHPILHLLKSVSESNDKPSRDVTLALFLDLSKAFDTINHTTLLAKLSHYGIRGTSNNWFRSYLTGRKQYTEVNNMQSRTMNINCGVPQGSVLGPLLFIIYTNDLPNSLNYTHAILFADDTTIYTKSDNIKTLYQNVNSDLNGLNEWFKANKLSLNVGKTHYMLLTNNNTPESITNQYDIKIGMEEIERKKHVKFLGVVIDDNLNWHEHITSTVNKISKITYTLKMIKNTLPKQNLKTLYETLIQPHLNYGITLWGGTHDTHVNKLIVQQKKIIRTITNSKYN